MVTHVVPPLAPIPPIPPHVWSRPSLLLHTRPLSLVTQRAAHLFSMNTHFSRPPHDPYIDRQTAEQTRSRVPSSVPSPDHVVGRF